MGDSDPVSKKVDGIHEDGTQGCILGYTYALSHTNTYRNVDLEAHTCPKNEEEKDRNLTPISKIFKDTDIVVDNKSMPLLALWLEEGIKGLRNSAV